MNFSIFIFLVCLIKSAICLGCQPISPNLQIPPNKIILPQNNSINPIVLPANFSCQYTASAGNFSYVQINVHQELGNFADVVRIDDGLGHVENISRNSLQDTILYQPPNSNFTIFIETGDQSNSSKVLISLQYFKVPEPQYKSMEDSRTVTYFDINQAILQPITVSGSERIVATISRSGYNNESFSSFYIYDGIMGNSSNIYRLDDFWDNPNIVSSGRELSVVGFSNESFHSVVIFNRYSAISKFDKFAGFAIWHKIYDIQVSAVELKTALSFVARESNQLVLKGLDMQGYGNGKCLVLAIPGSLDNDGVLIDFSPNQTYSLPQNFPAKFFTLIIDHCSGLLRITDNLDDDYYTVKDYDHRVVFSPSYLDPKASSEINETYVFNSTSSIQFSVNVDNVSIARNGDELDIFVLNKNNMKEMSVVLTESQSGIQSKAFGNSLVIYMNNSTAGSYSKISFGVKSNGFKDFLWIPILFSIINYNFLLI